MEKEELKKRTEEEMNDVHEDLPEQTIAAMDKRARNLYAVIKANGEMNSALSFKAFEVAKDMRSIVASLGLKAEFSEIEISNNLDETLNSIGKFVTSCSNAIEQIKGARKEASEQLNKLADAVDSSKNPNEDRVKAHVDQIMTKLKYKIYK